MAEKNQVKLSPFEKESIETAKQILEYKVGAEANVVAIIYKSWFQPVPLPVDVSVPPAS